MKRILRIGMDVHSTNCTLQDKRINLLPFSVDFLWMIFYYPSFFSFCCFTGKYIVMFGLDKICPTWQIYAFWKNYLPFTFHILKP